MRRLEEGIQRAVVGHLRARARPGVFFTHVPLGGYRRPVEAAILKGMGTRAGVPDILIIHAGQTYGLELKAPDGSVSPAQSECHADMRAAGARVAVAFSVDEAVHQLEAWSLLRGAMQ